MSKTIIVGDKQSVIDIAIQHCGDVDRIMDIVEFNTNIKTVNDPTGYDIDLGECIIPGTTLIIEDDWVNQKEIVSITSPIATGE